MNTTDTFTEVTQTSWFGRIKQSITGMLVGLLMLIGSFPLLFWNEGRAVQTARTLDQGAGLVRSVSATQMDPANEGALIHLSGEMRTDATLTDATFGISLNAIRLSREVGMYQWRETKSSEDTDKLGGGKETVTTYRYETVWNTGPIHSAQFKSPDGHQNPAEMPLQPTAQTAANVTVGAFSLPPSLVDDLGSGEMLSVTQTMLKTDAANKAAVAHDGLIYLGDPAAPQVGDVRVRFDDTFIYHKKYFFNRSRNAGIDQAIIQELIGSIKNCGSKIYPVRKRYSK